MTKKVIILNNCSNCPYKYWDKAGQERFCMLNGGRIIDVAITAIPEWCELENYVEAKEKTDKG